MRKQIQISVTDPCTQDWNAMHPSYNGRHCDHCAKTVIDFTGKSDAEIYRLLSKTNEHVCGRFTNFQLDRPIMKPVSEKKKTIAAWFFTTILAFTSGMVQAQKKKTASRAKIVTTKCETPTVVQGDVEVVTMGLVAAPQNRLSVTNEKKEPIVGATVYIMGNLKPLITNENGEVWFQAPDSAKVYISMIGYESQELLIDKNEIEVKLKQKQSDLQPVHIETMLTGVMGEVVITSTKRKQQIIKWDIIEKPHTKQSFIKNVFPNPVKAGSSINIELPTGDYELRLINTNGRLLTREKALVSKGLYASFQIPEGLSSGNVFLNVINIKTKQQSVKTLLIVQ